MGAYPGRFLDGVYLVDNRGYRVYGFLGPVEPLAGRYRQ